MSAEKIIDRIRKLLALSKSTNVHEAAAAAAAAQRLMTQHQIEEAVLEVDAGEDAREEPIGEETLDGAGARRKVRWAGVLAGHLARANGCRMYWFGARMQLVGPASSISVVRYMHAYLTREIERLCREARAKSPGSSVNPRAWGNSFRHGAVTEIGMRLAAAKRDAIAHERELAEAAARVQGTGTSLVRLDSALAKIKAHEERLEAAMKARNLRSSRPIQISSADAYTQGRVAARKIKLDGGPALGRGSRGDLKA